MNNNDFPSPDLAVDEIDLAKTLAVPADLLASNQALKRAAKLPKHIAVNIYGNGKIDLSGFTDYDVELDDELWSALALYSKLSPATDLTLTTLCG